MPEVVAPVAREVAPYAPPRSTNAKARAVPGCRESSTARVGANGAWVVSARFVKRPSDGRASSTRLLAIQTHGRSARAPQVERARL